MAYDRDGDRHRVSCRIVLVCSPIISIVFTNSNVTSRTPDAPFRIAMTLPPINRRRDNAVRRVVNALVY